MQYTFFIAIAGAVNKTRGSKCIYLIISVYYRIQIFIPTLMLYYLYYQEDLSMWLVAAYSCFKQACDVFEVFLLNLVVDHYGNLLVQDLSYWNYVVQSW